MKVIVTGGGSGGHVYPAVAIADRFREADPSNDIRYIGYEDGFEKRVVPNSGYHLYEIDTRWVDRSSIKEMFLTVKHVTHGIRQAKSILKEFRPDVIIGTGGYVCFPVIYAGHKLGIPCYIHEQNAFPGLANRQLEKYVQKVFLGFEAGGRYFKDKTKLIVSGNPVRKAFFELSKEDARRKLGINEDEFMILSFGGSLGAEVLNNVVFELMKKINGKPKTSLVFGTGRWYYDDVIKKIKGEGIEIAPNVAVKSYIEDMDNYLAASDLIISRAGALSVAETLVSSKASILVPSPNVTGNHQFFNARAVADKGGAVLIEEKDLTPEVLIKNVEYFMTHPVELDDMGQKAGLAAPRDATDIIYTGIMEDLK